MMQNKSRRKRNDNLEPTYVPSRGTGRAWVSWTTHCALSKKKFQTSVNRCGYRGALLLWEIALLPRQEN